jgi:hypothetical protein
MQSVAIALPFVVFGVFFALIYRREKRLQRPKAEARRRARFHLGVSFAAFGLMALAAALEFWPLFVLACLLLLFEIVQSFR